ncbi:MAG: hypothetical protein GXY23_10845, partial [Myxococcales bacterium]|nr:hypothetical protein [Myxococcales bacterium]
MRTALFSSAFLLTMLMVVRASASPRDRICDVEPLHPSSRVLPACFPVEPRHGDAHEPPLAAVRAAMKKNDAYRALTLLDRLDDLYPE